MSALDNSTVLDYHKCILRMKGYVVVLPCFRASRFVLVLLGSFIQAVGLCNVHAFADVTEGGVLGMTLLLDHWLHISPAISSAVLNALCYWIGWRTMGKEFLWYSILAGVGFSVSYALLEPFAPMFPWMIASPFAAAIWGAVFVGIGAGLCVRMESAPGGDDALAMAISRITKIDIQWVYLLTDFTVLALSATYIAWEKLGWSLLTVVLSGQIIGWVVKIPALRKKEGQS